MSAHLTPPKKILLFITEDWYFWSHRLPLARAAMQAGYAVTLVTRVNQLGDRIRAEGVRLLPLALERRGSHPWREWRTFRELLRVYRAERPDLVHHVALKPVIYGSLAAWLTGVRCVVNALAGLGYVFTSRHWRARLLRPWITLAYRLLLNRSGTRTIVQNPDDLALLVQRGALKAENAVLIRGSGVDLHHFAPLPEPTGEVVVALVSRMLWDKGVGEFVAAARQLRQQGLTARFVLVGASDAANPAAVPVPQLTQWAADGVVEWWGHQEDVRAVFAGVHVVCLPSYREGLPKVLIEAAACARPLIASDVPGCREVVRHEETGLLVPVRSAERLAQAIECLVHDAGLRRRLGAQARCRAEREFADKAVATQTLALYRELLA